MLKAPLRQAATVLLESAIRIAPPEAREWGEAMRGELNYVESSWAATSWALGGAGVMAKQALMSLLVPGRTGNEAMKCIGTPQKDRRRGFLSPPVNANRTPPVGGGT